MPARRSSRVRTVSLESLENRQLFALALNPLPTTGGVRFDSVATDAAGNIFAVGEFAGQTTFDTAGKIKINALGDQDAFIMRIAASNGATIVRRLGSTSAPLGVNKLVTAVKVIVQDGHVVVIGGFSGTVDLDPTKGVHSVVSQGIGDGFILDLSATNLAYNWSTVFGGTGQDDALMLDRDSKGNTWVAGDFEGTLKFAGTTKTLKSGGAFDAFAAKFGPTGQYLFGARIGGTGGEVFRTVVIDSKDNVFLGGQFQNTVDTNPGKGTSNLTTIANSNSGMIVELNSAGVFVGSRGLIGNGFGTITSLALDSKDSLYFIDNFDGTVDANPGAAVLNLTTKGGGDILLGKLDTAMNLVWAYGLGGTAADQAHDLSVDLKNQVLLNGTTQGTFDLNPGKAKANITSDGQGDGFFACYSAAGKFLGAAQVGGTGDNITRAVGRSGNTFILLQNFQDSIDLAPRKIPGGLPVPHLFDSAGKVDAVMLLVLPSLVGAV